MSVKFTITNLMDTYLEIVNPQDQPQRPYSLKEQVPTVILPGQTAGPFVTKKGVSERMKLWERRGRIRIDYIEDDAPAAPQSKPEKEDKSTSKDEEKDT